MSARALVRLLQEPGSAAALSGTDWTAIISAARAERLAGTLADRVAGVALPPPVQRMLGEALHDAEREQRNALWEARCAALALIAVDTPVILLKGAAYAAIGHQAARGRHVGDLDILVPRERLAAVEAALLAAGWEWVKNDPYDDQYYRNWMHELPPMIHAVRDRMIDVHHAILPLTARPEPDMAAMIADAVPIGDGLAVLGPHDRIVHAVAHLFADGDLDGGLRNLWDIHCMLSRDAGDWQALMARAQRHGVCHAVARAARLAHHVFGSAVPPRYRRLALTDRLFAARLLDRSGTGERNHKLLGIAFYIRSHLLRMPLLMLLRHLLTKWRKGHRPV